MTLAVVAGRLPDVRTEVFHAVSPAVPPEATARVRTTMREEHEENSNDGHSSNP